jgi:hypothetical protein
MVESKAAQQWRSIECTLYQLWQEIHPAHSDHREGHSAGQNGARGSSPVLVTARVCWCSGWSGRIWPGGGMPEGFMACKRAGVRIRLRGQALRRSGWCAWRGLSADLCGGLRCAVALSLFAPSGRTLDRTHLWHDRPAPRRIALRGQAPAALAALPWRSAARGGQDYLLLGLAARSAVMTGAHGTALTRSPCSLKAPGYARAGHHQASAASGAVRDGTSAESGHAE